MEDLHAIGGIPAILKYLLNHTNLIDGNQLTITGKTLAENLEDVAELEFEKQDVVRRLDNPIKKTGHLTILRGNLAPGTAVAKLTGKEGLRFEVSILASQHLIESPSAHYGIRVLRSASTGLFSVVSMPPCILTICSLDGFYPALESGEIKPGMVLIFRYQGPKGAPGMPEMLGKISAM